MRLEDAVSRFSLPECDCAKNHTSPLSKPEQALKYALSEMLNVQTLWPNAGPSHVLNCSADPCGHSRMEGAWCQRIVVLEVLRHHDLILQPSPSRGATYLAQKEGNKTIHQKQSASSALFLLFRHSHFQPRNAPSKTNEAGQQNW